MPWASTTWQVLKKCISFSVVIQSDSTRSGQYEQKDVYSEESWLGNTSTHGEPWEHPTFSNDPSSLPSKDGDRNKHSPTLGNPSARRMKLGPWRLGRSRGGVRRWKKQNKVGKKYALVPTKDWLRMLKGNLMEEVLKFTLDFVYLCGHLRLSSFK